MECDKNKSSYPTLNFVLHALHSSQTAYHRAESCNACVMRVIPVMRAYAVCNTKKKSAKPLAIDFAADVMRVMRKKKWRMIE